MKKIISYVLFGNHSRYWSNLSYLLLVNSAVYPDFISRFYVHVDCQDNPFLVMLKEAEAKTGKVEVIMCDDISEGTKLTAWRLKPLWEDDIEIMLCRDADYHINKFERKAVEFFMMQQKYIVQGIRGYHLHTIPYLTGLCTYKVPEVKKYIMSVFSSFEELISWANKEIGLCKNWDWGCDQALLGRFLEKAKLYPLSMDCPQFNAPHYIHGYPAHLVTPDKYENIIMQNGDEKILEASNSIYAGWTGQPWDCITDDVKTICEMVSGEISEIVKPFI